MIASFLALAPLLASSPTPSVNVIVVSPLVSSGDYTTISAAIEAAIDGDTILIRSGTYGFFVVNNKDLDLLAADSAVVEIVGYAGVANLAQHKEVLFSGLRMLDGDQWAGTPAFIAQDCIGAVRVADCSIEGKDWADYAINGGPGARVTGCADIAFYGCTIEGGDAGMGQQFCSSTIGGVGLLVEDSTITLHVTTIAGGQSSDILSTLELGGPGGDACLVTGQSFLRAFGCSFQGADGGHGDASFTFCTCGDGGAGLSVSSSSQAELQDCTTTGGAAGIFYFTPVSCDDGDDRSGPIVDLPGVGRSIQADRIVRTDGTLNASVHGQPGDGVFLLISTIPAHYPYPALSGVLHVGSPYIERALPVGMIGPSGVLPIQWPLGPAWPGVQAAHLYVQPIISNASGRWIASPAAVLVLDPSF